MRSTIILLAFIAVFAYACGGGSSASDTASSAPPQSMIADEPAADSKGVGEVKEVALTTPLDQAMIAKGKGVYELKCAACHKLTTQRVVGPGFGGVTERRTPEWIMNMILNVDVMLEEDPAARKMLEECLVRMPNQNLSYDDARAVLEYFRMNDGEE
jgi:mono/diheme cytochrome c family protein